MKNTYHYDIIAKAISFIKNHHKEQPSLDEIANQFNLSKFHFQRVFKKWVGISPKDYLQFITLEKAKESLRKGKSTLETSYTIGLSGNSRLHDLFIKIEGCTPGEFQKRGRNLKFHIGEIETPFGNAIIVETQKGISSLSFDKSHFERIKKEYDQAIFINELATNGKIVQEYFKNWKIPLTSISLDLVGTSFQIQVWKALLQIPSSNLLAYQDIAKMIDNPKAVRAVGTAIGKNPIAYLIPCHRVIKSDGNMGDYRWSTERKIAINSYESIKL
ncbi:bifunctional helix-turn-helix domain-containing protein/methylated-DNA--[protein]-cysteine S-methyltransferase [Tenacibaculum agarivorans]|uniref:bifunctional helix-turn-helix domain-containing protein/methylated-DNA--[protein]-cysteine S-methyltransferase n=1 Tax=Tenacibaculum agarivorans TaxID=1908389 RepID=UPI00094BBD42|nr:methylated-DNA--[protein]-cysteine S-methyltransferase [Tenacibaculum agarivorans]